LYSSRSTCGYKRYRRRGKRGRITNHTHIFRMMYLQLDGCTVAGARVVTGDTEDEGRGVVLQITPTSSEWSQLFSPNGRKRHSSIWFSFPWHVKSSSQICPVPSPNRPSVIAVPPFLKYKSDSDKIHSL
jgi:hypothetical protein